MRRLFFSSYDGYYANAAEGTLIREFFALNGYEVVDEPRDADLVVYNTCAFDRRAEDRSLSEIAKLQAVTRPGAELFVTGCLPGINPDRLKNQVVGRTITPQNLGELDQMFEATVRFEDVRRRLRAGPGKCLIEVATGCLGSCSFCGIKNAIGQVKSRSVPDILAEFDSHYAAGHRKFVLASHDFGAYGRDIRTDAVTLLGNVVARPGDFKVEIEWIDPKWLYLMLDGFIEVLRTGKLARYFYLSLQSGSARILKLMRRHYTPEQVRTCLRRLNDEVTDFRPQIEVIVGFPTETEADFHATLRFLRDFTFLDINAYKFDPKPGTEAALMDGQIPAEVKERRLQEVRQVIQQNRLFSAFGEWRRGPVR